MMYEVSFKSDDPESESYLLADLGITHTEIRIPDLIICYITADTVDGLNNILEQVKSKGIQYNSHRPYNDQDWIRRSINTWEPLKIGALTISYVQSDDDKYPVEHKHIQIIPGTGFGTGHHATTATVLQFMQHPLVTANTPAHILDLGCGSAILSLAACQIFDCHVDAIDNDPLALQNAARNIALNNLENRITLTAGTLSSVLSDYNLILANIYSSTLISLQPAIGAACANSAQVILSGLLDEQAEEVIKRYEQSNFKLQEHTSVDGWSTLLLRRLNT